MEFIPNAHFCLETQKTNKKKIAIADESYKI